MNDGITSTMETNAEDRVMSLEKQLRDLEEELSFIKSLWTKHPGSVVYHMHIKTKNGKKVWINVRDATLAELITLDQDEDIQEWIDDCRCPFDNRMRWSY